MIETTFRALSEPRRVDILKLLRGGPMAAGEIAARFPDVTRPAISQHLRVLVNSGLISERKDATRRLYQLREEGFGPLARFIDEFWDDSLERLKRMAEKQQQEEGKNEHD